MSKGNSRPRARYEVDWSDSGFPKIVRMADDDEDRYGNAQTLAEAKREVRDHFASVIEHARNQIRALNLLRASDIEEDRA